MSKIETAPFASWWDDSLSYEAYLAEWGIKLEIPLTGLDKSARKLVYYARYNHERAAQVQRAYETSTKLRAALGDVDEAQVWMVLTEDWCVDSAFSLPVIAAAAAAHDDVTLRIVPRDRRPDVMDQHLTDGARSIPKLIAFGPDGTERFSWGPRPARVQALRARLRAEGAEGPVVSKAVLDWYEAGGWQDVEAELAAVLEPVRTM